MCAVDGRSSGDNGHFFHDSQGDAASGQASADVLRVTIDLAERVGRWSGVDACCDNGVAMGQLRPHFDQWLAETVASHEGRKLLSSGWLDGEVKCESARHPFGRKRCKGWFTKIVCYADFAPA